MIDRETGWYFTPTSVKAAVLRDGDVLLCRNRRDEWELPGGWPDRHDLSLEDTIRREVLEETGLEVGAVEMVTASLFRVTAESPVVLVVFRAVVDGDALPVPSSEHLAVTFFPADHLPAALPDVYRRAVSLAVNHHRGAAMAGMIHISEGRDWDAASWLFNWVVTALARRVEDRELAGYLNGIVAEHFGWLSFEDLTPQQRKELTRIMQQFLVVMADQEFRPDTPRREHVLAYLGELVSMSSEPIEAD